MVTSFSLGTVEKIQFDIPRPVYYHDSFVRINAKLLQASNTKIGTCECIYWDAANDGWRQVTTSNVSGDLTLVRVVDQLIDQRKKEHLSSTGLADVDLSQAPFEGAILSGNSGDLIELQGLKIWNGTGYVQIDPAVHTALATTFTVIPLQISGKDTKKLIKFKV